MMPSIINMSLNSYFKDIAFITGAVFMIVTLYKIAGLLKNAIPIKNV